MTGKYPAFIISLFLLAFSAPQAGALTSQEQLGKYLFFDADLSEPRGQSCAACHSPEAGYTGPDEAINRAGAVYEGAAAGRFGGRKPPTVAYAGDSPKLQLTDKKIWKGGVFPDGRATGWFHADPLAEQAQGSFLNLLEQNLPGAVELASRVCQATYKNLFEYVCGSCVDIPADTALHCIAAAIAAYERSSEVSRFSSKYDRMLAGKAFLSEKEKLGLELFKGKANCEVCHVPPLFTDYTYDNPGFPKNPANPYYTVLDINPLGGVWADPGLGGFLKTCCGPMVYSREAGKFKVPTLRNVDKRMSADFVKAYGHNGYFKSLESIVHFYNTRDVLPRCAPSKKSKLVEGETCWPSPEMPVRVNHRDMGNLKLTAGEEAALVEFLKALTDG